ncbi:MAG TPA: hypothetical protein PKG52_06835 [bacterium]|nr:hypothetical protein [bacterium]HPS28818.1 hypothetical protein [bacterium]
MSGKIVERLLDKVPFSNEIREAIKENLDLTFTKQLASEIVHQISGQSDKLKKEIAAGISNEIQRELSRIDKPELLAKTLENLEITISFKRKPS